MSGTKQTKQFKTTYEENGRMHSMVATVRYDECGNGHNTFAVTADIRVNGRWEMGGCCHDEIKKHLPELAPILKWHLCGSDGPMHYVANSLYWAGKSGWCDSEKNSPPNLDHFRSSAIWPEATQEIMDLDKENLKNLLLERLTETMKDFRENVEELGFIY